MRLNVGQLQYLIRHLHEADGDGKKGEGETTEKDAPWWSDYYCKMHLVPLEAIWGKRDERMMPVPTDAGNVQAFGPLKKGERRGILPPTKDRPEHPTSVYIPPKGVIKALVCPLSKEPGPYAVTAERPSGRACDYVVLPRKIGNRTGWVALGEVANEMGVAYNPDMQGPLAPRKKKHIDVSAADQERLDRGEVIPRLVAIPRALNDKIDEIEAHKVAYRKQEGLPAPSKEHPLTFTNNELLYLSRDYRNKLIQAKAVTEDEGMPYKGPEPYWTKGVEIFRELLRRGWELAQPEKERPVRRALPAMPGRPIGRVPALGGDIADDPDAWYAEELPDDEEHDTDDLETPDTLDLPDEDGFRVKEGSVPMFRFRDAGPRGVRETKGRDITDVPASVMADLSPEEYETFKAQLMQRTGQWPRGEEYIDAWLDPKRREQVMADLRAHRGEDDEEMMSPSSSGFRPAAGTEAGTAVSRPRNPIQVFKSRV